MNKFKITQTQSLEFGDFTKTTFAIEKKNKSKVSLADVVKLDDLMFTKAQEKGTKFIVRAVVGDKTITLKTYDSDFVNVLDEELYLNGRKKGDTGFVSKFDNIYVTINKPK